MLRIFEIDRAGDGGTVVCASALAPEPSCFDSPMGKAIPLRLIRR